MKLLVIALREVKLGFRNPWAYSFLALYTLFSIALLLIQNQSAIEGYTAATGSMLNLILYLLPLMTLILGAFSITAEREEGGWDLLATYSISSLSYLLGKFIGLAVVLIAIVSVGFGLSGLIGAAFGEGYSLSAFGFFFTFSCWLVLLFLGLSLVVGALSGNRWQALTGAVGVWFVSVLAWPSLLVSFLSLLPYLWIKPTLIGLTFANPAELVRIYMVSRLGGGSIFGPEYFRWVGWLNQPSAPAVFMAVGLGWVVLAVGAATAVWERRRAHD